MSLFGNHAVRIADIAKLRQWTTLPIAVKGIVHPDDAREAVAAGANGIVVSNHGGRQVDGRFRRSTLSVPSLMRWGMRWTS